MRIRTLVLTLVLISALAPISGPVARQPSPLSREDPDLGDEFVGPFPSWTNLKTAYGAVGDGMVDDTVPLQKALTELGARGHSPVLFIPRGTYRITQMLTLAYVSNVSVIGEDPAATIIAWDGAPDATMLLVNGVAYSRVARLTLNGAGRATVAVEQTWDKARGSFDTGNEYADDRFVDVGYGIHGGFKDAGFAETSIVRSAFVRNTAAGVALGNFNALDIWIWHSLFDGCRVGVTNGTGAGNFHVYNSVFRRSAVSDLAIGNTGGFSARGNYSIGSQAFFVSVAAKTYPATIHLQRNTILDPASSIAIDLRNQGPGVLTDNVIRSLPSAAGPIVRWVGADGADVVSVGNTFTVGEPVRASGRLLSIDDRVVPRASIDAKEPVLPGAARHRARPIFDVESGARGRDIQQAIDRAALRAGERPVVHVPHGTYSIAATLNVPAGDVQLVGDGFGTILRWAGSGRGPVMRLQGPSKATLREIEIDGAGSADGAIVERADQIGSRVFLDQVQLRSGKQADLSIDGLDHAYIEARDLGHAYSPTAVSVKATGRARTNIFSGASSGNAVSYDVSGGARVLVRDLWYESGAGAGFANIHGAATFTIDGARVASPVDGARPAFAIDSLQGEAAIVATYIDDRIELSGNGSDARVLAVAVFDAQPDAKSLSITASPPARALRVGSRYRRPAGPGNWSLPTPDSAIVDPAFVSSLLSHTRSEMPQPIADLPQGITDVRMFRVWITGGIANLTLGR